MLDNFIGLARPLYREEAKEEKEGVGFSKRATLREAMNKKEDEGLSKEEKDNYYAIRKKNLEEIIKKKFVTSEFSLFNI